MILKIDSILLRPDASGELWIGEGNALTFTWHHKDVVALNGKTVSLQGNQLFLGIKPLGRVDTERKVHWVNRRQFLEAVSQ